MESSDLRKAGLKVTLPRVKILEILAGNQDEVRRSLRAFARALDASAGSP